MIVQNADQALFRRKRELLEAPFGEELVALDREEGVCLGFNGVAARIWAMLDTPLPASEIANRLVNEYDVDRHECISDVVQLLGEFEQMGLVVAAPAPDRFRVGNGE